MKAIVSNEYIFQLRLNDYNLKRGLENYTVSKIFEPHVSQEVQLQKVTFNYVFFIQKKKKKLYTQFLQNNLNHILMKFNDNRKLQLSLKKIQKTNKPSLNILRCLFPYLLKILNQMMMMIC
jgi:hypothetical protein